jgi:quercetin dioxygenase-like cupin family protein
MAIMQDDKTEGKQIAPGISRKLIYLNGLMSAVLDFTNGPQEKPDPPHSHSHEQISYVAEGEIYVFIDGEKTHLKKGDVFAVQGDVPHCIQTLTPHVRLVDNFSPIREDFLK